MEQLPSAAIAAMAAKAQRLPERPPFECIALLAGLSIALNLFLPLMDDVAALERLLQPRF